MPVKTVNTWVEYTETFTETRFATATYVSPLVLYFSSILLTPLQIDGIHYSLHGCPVVSRIALGADAPRERSHAVRFPACQWKGSRRLSSIT